MRLAGQEAESSLLDLWLLERLVRNTLLEDRLHLVEHIVFVGGIAGKGSGRAQQRPEHGEELHLAVDSGEATAADCNSNRPTSYYFNIF